MTYPLPPDKDPRFSIKYQDGGGATGTVRPSSWSFEAALLRIGTQVARDTVAVAGVTVYNQGFGAITSETGNFGDGVCCDERVPMQPASVLPHLA